MVNFIPVAVDSPTQERTGNDTRLYTRTSQEEVPLRGCTSG